jgi:hypothetical protein
MLIFSFKSVDEDFLKGRRIKGIFYVRPFDCLFVYLIERRNIMNTLQIEWQHLDKDGDTCNRCSNTGEAVKTAYAVLAKELKAKDWDVQLKETQLTKDQIEDSNKILFNGVAIEELLPDTKQSENSCTSCGDIIGESTSCRTLERNGLSFETIPSYMIIEAAYRQIKTEDDVLGGCANGNCSIKK